MRHSECDNCSDNQQSSRQQESTGETTSGGDDVAGGDWRREPEDIAAQLNNLSARVKYQFDLHATAADVPVKNLEAQRDSSI